MDNVVHVRVVDDAPVHKTGLSNSVQQDRDWKEEYDTDVSIIERVGCSLQTGTDENPCGACFGFELRA